MGMLLALARNIPQAHAALVAGAVLAAVVLGIGVNLATAPAHQKVRDELAAALRSHIQRGGAVPWQRPHPTTH